MRVLLFIIWLALGVVYGLIWMQRKTCCDPNVAIQPSNEINNATIPANPTSSIDSGNHPILSPAVTSPTTTRRDITAEIDNKAAIEDQGCVLFKWGQSDPILKPCFAAFKDSVIKSYKSGQTFEIINEYYEQENQVMSTANLGIIRSAKLKDLFSKDISPENIKLRSIARSDSTGKRNRLLYTLHTRQIFMNDQVKELDDKTLIYFKYASNQHENDILVNEYIDELAVRLKNTSDIVKLTGHTDDDATAEHNMALGLRRAQLIKDLLVAKGIKANRIKVTSKGESEPIAPNDTEENRKQNRRVELVMVPSNKQ